MPDANGSNNERKLALDSICSFAIDVDDVLYNVTLWVYTDSQSQDYTTPINSNNNYFVLE